MRVPIGPHNLSYRVSIDPHGLSYGGTYEALHLSHDQRSAINVADLTHFFTVCRLNIVRKKLKISAQMDESFWRYRRYKYTGVGYI